MKTFAKAPLAVAIAAFLAAPCALAQYSGSNGSNGSNDFDTDAYLDVDVENDISVSLEHNVKNSIDVGISYEMVADPADHFSAATIDRKQFTDDNAVKSDFTENNSELIGSGNGATGNIGINVASGDLNKQANDTAIASGNQGGEGGEQLTSMMWGGHNGGGGNNGGNGNDDAAMVFAKAATFSIQSSSNNSYDNDGTTNSAVLNNSLNNVSGNIGVNMASGAGNIQNNAMTLAVGQDSSAEATTGGVQVSYNNVSDGDLGVAHAGWSVYVQNNSNNAQLNNALSGAAGNVGVSIASGNGNMQSNTLSIARAQ